MERHRASPAVLAAALVLAMVAIPAVMASALSGVVFANDITVYDGENWANRDPLSYGGITYNPWYGSQAVVDGDGAFYENNEVEPYTVTGQQWDLEGMYLYYDPAVNARQLVLVGGWDFINGVNHGGTQYTSGDVFIALQGMGSDPPNFGTGPGNGTGYDYVLQMNWGLGTFNIVNVNGLSVGTHTTGDLFGVNTSVNVSESNPWRYNTGGASTGVSGTVALYSAANRPGYSTDAYLLTGPSPLESVTGTGTSNRYAAVFNLWGGQYDFLFGQPNQDIMFHFTQSCGNDLLHGRLSDGGTYIYPEPATLGLLGLALAGLGIRRRMVKK